MALLLNNGAVFLHVPKTGGSFIGHVLHDLNLVHRDLGGHSSHDRVYWNDRLQHDGKIFRNLLRHRLGWLPRCDPTGFRFCFIREPLSWYVSYWRYMQHRNWRQQGDVRNPHHWNPLEMLNGLGSSDFNEFVFNVNRRRPGYVTELFGWYARPSTNFVGKLEHLALDLQKVLAMMKVKVDLERIRQLPRVNEVPCAIARPAWDPALRLKTLQLEYAAYARFGYSVPSLDDDLADSFLSATDECQRHADLP